MKLYYSPGACSMAAHIVASEAGVKLQLVKVNLPTHKLEDGTDYYTINPRGYVPALTLDDGSLLTEVVAIIQYLADQNPGAKLMPEQGSFERVRLTQWLAFISSELHKVFSPWLWHKETAESTKQTVKDKLGVRFRELDTLFAKQEFVLGKQFTIADAYLFTIVNWTNFVGISLLQYPSLAAYQQRIAARPKVAEALAAEGLLKKAA
jgi:glutathione S-transferase